MSKKSNAPSPVNPKRRAADGTILVTGGSGHLGANLVRALLANGRALRVLIRRGSDNRALEGLDVEYVYGDLRDLASLRRAAAECSYIYHAAAKVSTIEGSPEHRREIYDTNVIGTKNLLLAARETGVKRVVVTGSFSATGYHLANPSKPASEDVPVYPFTRHMPYEESKVYVEHECLKAYAEGLDVVLATSCAIIGPNDYKPSRMGQTLCDFANRKLRAYIDGGFEFVSTQDIVNGHLLAMSRGRSGQKYTFATRFLTIGEVMGYFEQITGEKRPRLRLPAPLMAGIAEVSTRVMSRFFPNAPQRLTPGAVRILRLERHADCNRACEELGYQPTSMLDAFHRAYEDFLRRDVIVRAKSISLAEPELSAAKNNPATSSETSTSDPASADPAIRQQVNGSESVSGSSAARIEQTAQESEKGGHHGRDKRKRSRKRQRPAVV